MQKTGQSETNVHMCKWEGWRGNRGCPLCWPGGAAVRRVQVGRACEPSVGRHVPLCLHYEGRPAAMQSLAAMHRTC